MIVPVGKTTDLQMRAELAAGVKTLPHASAAPIIDPKSTGTTTNFTADELRSIPTSRDPFALLRTVPGVLLDQVNVGGNETGQQALVLGKAARQQDTSWTIDGIEITDMGAPGQSPTYFNFDNFEEIQVATAGKDIRSRTGGVGINLVTKRGTNLFHGGVRNYFTSDGLGGSNVPDELQAPADSGDARQRPITRSRSPTTASTSAVPLVEGQGVVLRVAVAAGHPDLPPLRRNAIDKTELRNPQVKVNWQATSRDMVNFLFFNGYKLKDGRSTGERGISAEAFEATLHQDNAYSDSSRCTVCGRSATTASSARTCSCRRNTPTTTPASR